MSVSDAGPGAARSRGAAPLARQLLELLASGEAMPSREEQRLLSFLIRSYAERKQADPDGTGDPIDGADVAASEVAIVAAGLMRAAEISSFEIAALFNV